MAKQHSSRTSFAVETGAERAEEDVPTDQEMDQEIARPWFGRVLTALMALLAVTAIAVTSHDRDVGDVLRLAPWMLLLAGGTWAAFGRPHVAVDDDGVHLVNVTRTVHVPWPALRAVDTRWALTLATAQRSFVAWAAPAPGMRAALRATRQDIAHVPADHLAGPGMRPGDLPSSPSGDAAAMVRRRWQELRGAGDLDGAQVETDVPARAEWHTVTISIGLVLVGLCVVTLFV